MTSAGSFVHGDDGKIKSKDEQDIADFLSSIDEITSSASGAAASSRVDGSGVSFRGGSSPGGDLLFGPTSSSEQAAAGSKSALLLGSDDQGYGDPLPSDWLNELEGLQLGEADSSAPQREPTAVVATEQQQQQQQQQQQDQRAEHGETEILGQEPEILDDGGFVLSNNSGSSTAGGRLMSGGHMTRGNSSSTSASRGLGERSGAAAGGSIGPSSAAEKDAAAAAAANKQLDWPETLDVLGISAAAANELLDWTGTLDMLDMEGEKETGPTASGVGVPVSELPSMPPPATRQETFPDFVEIRDARRVSQFPKPDNALAARAATILGSGSSNSDGSGGGGDGDGGAGGAGGGGDGGKGGTGQKQVLPPPLRTVEVYLRPDVTWESVSDVYMAVMLSRGLVVREQTDKMVTAEKVGEGSGDWATVKLTVGVTRDKLRTLVMQFFADTRAPMLSLKGTMARFSGRAGDGLYVAIRDALVERRLPLSFLATDAEEVALDPHYVRDLVGMYAHENVVNLTRYALPLEEFVRREEEQSARLEATLLPQYRANGLDPPRPTRSKLLSSYPLTTRRPLVSSCGVEEAREVMERAREHVGLLRGGGLPSRRGEREEEKEEEDAAGGEGGMDGGGGRGGGGGEGGGSVAEGIRSLIRATWEDVKAWCDEEAEARVRRKDAQVRDRLLAVERHRKALVEVLRDGASGAATGGTPVGREFAARFRPMADEAVICQCKAMHAKRVGQLYLTCNHLCFHSSVLGFTFQRVLPLLTVASISHAPAALGMDVVTLLDRGGEAHLFGITAVEAGFPRRFHDLLQQCLVLCKEDASKRAAREGAAAEAKPDEEQILAKVQRLAKAKQAREAREAASAARAAAAAAAAAATPNATATTATATTTATSAAMPTPAAASPPPAEALAMGQGLERDSAVKEAGGASDREGLSGGDPRGGVAGTAEAGKQTKKGPVEAKRVGPQGRGGGRGGAGGGRAGSRMAMGIQAFLEESQKL